MTELSVLEVLASLRAAGEQTRLRILALLTFGELTVTELTTILRQSQPRVSRHLKLLCEAGLLERFREGTWIFYRLADSGEAGRLALQIVNMLPRQDQLLLTDQEQLSAVKEERHAVAATYFKENAERWDKIRSLYVPEGQVEAALLSLTEGRDIDDMLDVGTGTGRMLEVFSPRITRGIGVDLSHEMLAIARDNLERKGLRNCQVRHGDMYDLALSSETMDLVLFHQVLHFADNPLSAIREAGRLLKAGGRVIVVDFAPHNLEFLRDEHAHRRLGFGAKEISRWCEQAGLVPQPVIQMDGKELVVMIWAADKP
ncbi:MAG: ArsR family transcriptional regulator [Kordiimonas sp.]|nr:ArsR family transcriptional regulator [Kordiimonas sp.]|tara:strand:- start:221 stop:1162 length:942 start_codon:yes stop_codon:yes gene_type:complete